MPEEYDRLAWGLVRDEIRRLTQFSGKDDFEKGFMQILAPGSKSNFASGSLKEKDVGALRQRLVSDMQERLRGFRHESFRGRMGTNISFTKTQLDSMMFWAYSDLHIGEPGRERTEKFLEMRTMLLCASRKKVIADLLSAFIVVSEHTLYRLVQRGACDRNPLQMLTDDIDDWLCYAVFSMYTSTCSENQTARGFFIPYRNGALLGRLRFSQIAESCRTATIIDDMPVAPRGYRFIDSVKGRKVVDIPYQNVILAQKGEINGVLSAHVSTWVPEHRFGPSQWWAKHQLEQIRLKFPEEFSCHGAVVHSPTRETSEEFMAKVNERREKYVKTLTTMFSDPRWIESST